MKRAVFFISDSTGITVETLGHSLLTQFKQLDFEETTIPYINTIEKAEDVLEKINTQTKINQRKSLIFSSLVNPQIRHIVSQCDGLFIDYFNILLDQIANELHAKPTPAIGKSHSLVDRVNYENRIEAMHFALNTDDGNGLQYYDKVDLILIGTSRCGKTPTCLYAALQFGVFAANYPITEENMHYPELPSVLQPYKNKLFGLTIDSNKLHSIRERRKANSQYASLKQCQQEIQFIESLYQQENIPFLNSTLFSIEEISTRMIDTLGIKRHLL